jgi:hypothetical protein
MPQLQKTSFTALFKGIVEGVEVLFRVFVNGQFHAPGRFIPGKKASPGNYLVWRLDRLYSQSGHL